MSVTPDQGRAAAIDLIKPYVERGDSYEWLREGGMGAYLIGRYHANIGSFGVPSCRAPRKLGPDAITVSMVGHTPCCYHFSLRELYDEIRSGTKQLTLFGGVHE